MPCDYSKYPANWKTEIRPAILKREGNKCKFCNVQNGSIICRGFWRIFSNGKLYPVYQYEDGQIFNADTGEYLGDSYVGDVFTDEKQKVTKVILTIMHLDHDVTNNDYENLAAGCQRCHLKHDKQEHTKNAKATIKKKKGLQELF